MSEVFFGNTASSASAIAANFVYWFKATCTQDGNVTHMRANAQATGFNLKLAVYSVSGGNPSSLLGQSDALSVPSTGVNTIVVSSPFAVTNGTEYALAWLHDGGNRNMSTDATGTYYFLAATYPTFPSSAAGFTSASGLKGYIEAGVTAAASSTFIPLISIL